MDSEVQRKPRTTALILDDLEVAADTMCRQQEPRMMDTNEMTLDRACGLADNVSPAPAAAHAALVLLRDRWTKLGYAVCLYVAGVEQTTDDAARSRLFDSFAEEARGLLLDARKGGSDGA